MPTTYPVDLQLHSTCSDGTDSPMALVSLAAQRGIQVLALTDHDSVLGVDEATAAGNQLYVRVLPAIEFSTLNEPDRDLYDINILGYGIRHDDPELKATLQQVIESRIDQKVRQVERLQSYGIAVLAHPGVYTRVEDVDGVVRRLTDIGLDGLETRYPYAQNRGNFGASRRAVKQIIDHFDTLADECGLLKTGGSDYHGETKPGIEPGQAGLTMAEWRQLSDRLGW